jgi:hypothetical protein
MSEAKRQDMKDRIAAGEARHRAREESTLFDRAGEAAIEAKDRFTAFAHEHPLTAVAGGLAVGILISGLFPRSPTRRLGRRAAGLATVGAEAAMAYMHQAIDTAGDASRTGAHRLEDLGDTISDTARRVRRDAAYLLESVSDSARSVGRDASERVSRGLHRGR